MGQTHFSLARRWSGHLRDARSSSTRQRFPLHSAIRKYGKEAFDIEELEAGFVNQEAVNNAERYWIAKLKTRQRKIGYNLHEGGKSGGVPHSTTRAKMRIASQKRWADPAERAKMGLFQRGRKHTPETKAKIADSNRRRKYSLETKNKLREAALKQWETTDIRDRLRLANLGLIRSAETRAKIREANLSREKATPETCAKISAALRGKPKTPEAKAAFRAAWVKRKASALLSKTAPEAPPGRKLTLLKVRS